MHNPSRGPGKSRLALRQVPNEHIMLRERGLADEPLSIKKPHMSQNHPDLCSWTRCTHKRQGRVSLVLKNAFRLPPELEGVTVY